MTELIESIEAYRDRWGCLVCLPAVNSEGHHEDQEDSAHKEGHYLALRAWSKPSRSELEAPPVFMVYEANSISIRRHPLTKYTTSRDQVIPFCIGYFSNVTFSMRAHYLVTHWLRTCTVEKEKWKKYSWFIKMFYHTPNGDIFQPDHVAAFLRCKPVVTLWDRIRISFGDWWSLMGSFLYALTGFSKHHVNHTLMVEWGARNRVTAFSSFNLKFWRRYGQPERVYKEYFHTPNNPPIGDLYEYFRSMGTHI